MSDGHGGQSLWVDLCHGVGEVDEYSGYEKLNVLPFNWSRTPSRKSKSKRQTSFGDGLEEIPIGDGRRCGM